MKILMTIMFVGMTIQSTGYAHGTKSGMMSKALVQALADFENKANGAVLRRFVGTKGFYDGAELKVKIYLKKPEEEIRMICKEDHDSEGVVCSLVDEPSAEPGPEGGDHDH